MSNSKGNKQYKVLAKDTALFAISDFASKCITFLLLPLYTNVLATEEYGQLDLLNNMVNLIYPLLTLAIVEATIRFALDQDEKSNEVLSTALTLVSGGTLILILISPFSKLLGGTFSTYWISFILLFNGYSLRMLFSYYCRGKKKNVVFAIQGILQTVAVVSLNLLFLLVFKWGVKGYLIATIASYYIAVLYIILAGNFISDITDFKLNRSLMKRMVKFSLPLIPSLISWWIINSMDKYFIIAMVGMGASGVYAVAHKIPTILQTVTQIFNKAWQISSVSIYEDKDRDKKYTDIYAYFCFVCMAGCLVLNTFSKLIAKILFAKEYFEAWNYVPVLLVAAVFSSMAGFLAQIFTSAKKTAVLFKSTVLGAVVNAVLNYVLVKHFGAMGAAYGTLLAFVTVWLARDFNARKIINIKPDYLRLSLSAFVLMGHAVLVCHTGKYMYLFSLVCCAMFFFLNRKSVANVYRQGVNILRKFQKSKV